MRVSHALCSLTLVALLTGCTTEDARQADARRAVEAHVADDPEYSGDVHCTHNPRPWFVERETNVFLCVVRREQGAATSSVP